MKTSVNFSIQLGPWLAVEIPDLIARGVVVHKENQSSSQSNAEN